MCPYESLWYSFSDIAVYSIFMNARARFLEVGRSAPYFKDSGPKIELLATKHSTVVNITTYGERARQTLVRVCGQKEAYFLNKIAAQRYKLVHMPLRICGLVQ